MSDQRAPRLLIPDKAPLSLLSMLGKSALDWLFVLGAEACVTDMVRAATLRDPDPDDDQRLDQRQVLRERFRENRCRVMVQVTPDGQNYEREMRNWIQDGRVSEDKARSASMPSGISRGI